MIQHNEIYVLNEVCLDSNWVTQSKSYKVLHELSLQCCSDNVVFISLATELACSIDDDGAIWSQYLTLCNTAGIK